MATLLTKRGNVKPFAKVPALGGLPEIQPARATVSGVSSRRGVEGDPGVDLAEGCIVTKTIKYTHQLVHWVNAVRSGDPKDVVSEVPTRQLVRPAESLLKESVLEELGIIPYFGFTLDHPSNLAFRESDGFIFRNR